MEPLNFKQNSWHVRFTEFFSDLYDEDICSYTRKFIGACLITGIMTLLVLILGIPMIYSFVALLGFLFHFGHFNIKLVTNGEIVWIGIALSLGIFAFIHYSDYLNKFEKEPGAISQMYRHWKEKTCVKINFK